MIDEDSGMSEPASNMDIFKEWERTGKRCECNLCVRGRGFQDRMTKIPEDQREYFEALYETLMNTEMDLDYLQAIHDGSWPSAIEILEAALERARNHPNRATESSDSESQKGECP